jgi:hypothetical protein
MMFVTVAGGIRRVLLIQLRDSEDSGSIASHANAEERRPRDTLGVHAPSPPSGR